MKHETNALTEKQEKPCVIPAYINQLLKIYPSYGRDGSETKTIIRAFQFALKEFDTALIEAGFKDWLKTGDKMPVPSDIVRYCNTQERKQREEAQHQRIYGNLTKALPIPSKVVPWIGMNYTTAMQKYPQELTEHLSKLDNRRREGYIQYLKTHPGLE